MPPIYYDEGPDVHTMVTWLREQIKPALELASSSKQVYDHDEAQVVVFLDSHRATYQKEIIQLADVVHHHHDLRVVEVCFCVHHSSIWWSAFASCTMHSSSLSL